jgi:aryl-alcohol dehydrogenase-like predicted oxidoreductase
MASIHKIGIGTAQFGGNYGISNSKGQTSDVEVGEILNTAKAHGIRYIDTAAVYGNAELVLGKQDLKEFRVVSKFLPPIKKETIGSLLNQSLKTLNLDNIYGYLAHRPLSLLENKLYWQEMKDLKAEGLIRKIGYSLNNPLELDMLLKKKYFPDLVQVPFNYFDNRFENRLIELKEIGCEIHTRSTFLQGLFFMNPDKLGVFFDEIKPHIHNLQEQNQLLPEALLNHVLNNINIDHVILGVENNIQLLRNINSLNFSTRLEPRQFNFPDRIIMPMYWPK